MKKRKLKRREVLTAGAALAATGGVLAFDPARGLLAAIVDGIISSAKRRALVPRAEEEARNYLKVHLYGSPSRWIFDHPLRPSDKDGFCADPGIINRLNDFDPSRAHEISGRYEDVKVSGINMPYLWKHTVPGANGLERPLAELIHNMLIIRGCDMSEDGHPANSARLVAPVLGGPSLTALVAERTKASIPAVSIGRSPANRAFRSPLGVGLVEIPPEHFDYAQYLLGAFLPSAGHSNQSGEENLNTAIEEALGRLQDYSRSNNPGAEILGQERLRAEKLVRRGMASAVEGYAATVAKYSSIVDRAFSGAFIPGVNDRTVPSASLPLTVPGQAAVLDAFGRHHVGGKIICGGDYLQAIYSGKILELATRFALAEFVLTQGLSSSVLLAPSNEIGDILSGVTFPKAIGVEDVAARFNPESNTTTFEARAAMAEHRMDFSMDSHGVGLLPNLFSCTFYFRALGGCLLEIVERLKATNLNGRNLFDETVVHLSTEFERIPSKQLHDLDHNFRGQVTSIFSGLVKKPMVLGNILIGSPGAGGTSGIAAPVEGLDSKIVKISNISASMSQLLRVPKIVDRAQPLLEVRGGEIVPTIEPARNVEGEFAYKPA